MLSHLVVVLLWAHQPSNPAGVNTDRKSAGRSNTVLHSFGRSFGWGTRAAADAWLPTGVEPTRYPTSRCRNHQTGEKAHTHQRCASCMLERRFRFLFFFFFWLGTCEDLSSFFCCNNLATIIIVSTRVGTRAPVALGRRTFARFPNYNPPNCGERCLSPFFSRSEPERHRGNCSTLIAPTGENNHKKTAFGATHTRRAGQWKTLRINLECIAEL